LAADEQTDTTSDGRWTIRVLFVDDDASLREVYRIRLERHGYRVRIAESADDAVRAVKEERPDVIVLDIAMPERDGLSALQEFLDMDPSLPVIIHTAYPAYADNFLAWAADAYVVKAPDLAALFGAIEKAAASGRQDG